MNPNATDLLETNDTDINNSQVKPDIRINAYQSNTHYLINVIQIYQINLAHVLYTAIRELLKHATYKFCNSTNYINFRQITGCNKSLLITTNSSEYRSSIVIPAIMPNAV